MLDNLGLSSAEKRCEAEKRHDFRIFYRKMGYADRALTKPWAAGPAGTSQQGMLHEGPGNGRVVQPAW